MALSGTFVAGIGLVFTAKVFDSVTKQLADPDALDFSYAVNRGAVTTTSWLGQHPGHGSDRYERDAGRAVDGGLRHRVARRAAHVTTHPVQPRRSK
jgi:hypothetical protein